MQVKGASRYKVFKNGKVLGLMGRILSCRGLKNGYPYVFLVTDTGKRRHFYYHRIIAEAFISNPESKPVVHHKNRNKLDYRIRNLMWASYAENIIYEFDAGRLQVSRKLTNEQALVIRKRQGNGSTQRQIGEEFGVSRTTISRIFLGKMYKRAA